MSAWSFLKKERPFALSRKALGYEQEERFTRLIRLSLYSSLLTSRFDSEERLRCERVEIT